ncbi:MAG TPA: DNA polymerase III subunit epsilon [Candidatus Azoamicus sp.]
MKIISLDIETTGLLFYEGHKITEIACIEINNDEIKQNVFHTYINPKRKIDEKAKKITGLTEEFLADKPEFKNITPIFFNFIHGADEIIIHNAQFDVNFINNELKLINNDIKNLNDHFNIIDTLELARRLHPGKKNNLDSLCKRYDISLSKRTLHGALIDAELLAKVYIKMNKTTHSLKFKKSYNEPDIIKTLNTKLVKANKSELELHKNYIEKLKIK